VANFDGMKNQLFHIHAMYFFVTEIQKFHCRVYATLGEVMRDLFWERILLNFFMK